MLLQPKFLLTSMTKGVGISVGLVVLMLGGNAYGQTTTPDSSTTDSTTTPSQTRFACQMVNGQYTVIYFPESQPGQSYAWATPGAMGGGWSSDRRCNEISRRLESYRPDGLVEMKTAVENGYNTICVTTEQNAACRIVLTVPQGQDPLATRDRVFQNLTIADSGQQTQGVNTYTGTGSRNQGAVGDLINLGGQILGGGGSRSVASSGNINLRPFLDRADGGTGAMLRGGIPTRSNSPSPRLNPNNFK